MLAEATGSVRNRYKQGIKQGGMGTLCTVGRDGSPGRGVDDEGMYTKVL